MVSGVRDRQASCGESSPSVARSRATGPPGPPVPSGLKRVRTEVNSPGRLRWVGGRHRGRRGLREGRLWWSASDLFFENPIVVGQLWRAPRRNCWGIGLPAVSHEFVYRQSDIARDAAKQDRRQVATAVNRYGGCATVRMAEPFVRTALTDFREPERNENGDRFAGLEDGNWRQASSGHDDGLRPNELARHRGHPFLENHGDDFPEVGVELVQCLALAVRTRKPRNVSDVKARFRAAFHDRSEGIHRRQNPSWITSSF